MAKAKSQRYLRRQSLGGNSWTKEHRRGKASLARTLLKALQNATGERYLPKRWRPESLALSDQDENLGQFSDGNDKGYGGSTRW